MRNGAASPRPIRASTTDPPRLADHRRRAKATGSRWQSRSSAASLRYRPGAADKGPGEQRRPDDVRRSRALPPGDFHAQVATLFGFVRSAPLAGRRILIPGEPEARSRATQRRRRADRRRDVAADHGMRRRGRCRCLRSSDEGNRCDLHGDRRARHPPRAARDPARSAAPGLSAVASGKLEITVEAARPIDEWLAELPRLISTAQGK